MHALKHVPLVENRPGVELVEDLAENERIEQNAAGRRNEKEGKRGGTVNQKK